jgi:hypothetical protein
MSRATQLVTLDDGTEKRQATLIEALRAVNDDRTGRTRIVRQRGSRAVYEVRDLSGYLHHSGPSKARAVQVLKRLDLFGTLVRIAADDSRTEFEVQWAEDGKMQIVEVEP